MVVKKNLDIVIYEKLREKIINGEWKMGQKIFIDELAEVYGVSRTPVIQAIKNMNVQGMVVRSTSGKVYLSEFTKKQVLDICRTRLLIESEAIREIQEMDDNVAIESLSKIASLCSKYLKEERFVECRKADLELHKQLVTNSKNDCLVGIYSKVQGQFIVANYLVAFHEKENETFAVNEHDVILEALLSKQYDQAIKVLESHIMNAGRKIVERM